MPPRSLRPELSSQALENRNTTTSSRPDVQADYETISSLYAVKQKVFSDYERAQQKLTSTPEGKKLDEAHDATNKFEKEFSQAQTSFSKEVQEGKINQTTIDKYEEAKSNFVKSATENDQAFKVARERRGHELGEQQRLAQQTSNADSDYNRAFEQLKTKYTAEQIGKLEDVSKLRYTFDRALSQAPVKPPKHLEGAKEKKSEL